MAFFGPASAKNKKNFKKRPKRAKRIEVPKPCRFEKDGIFQIDYRETSTLHRYVSSQGKLSTGKRNGNTAFYQRQVALAVKRARYLALLPYVGE